LRIQHDGFSKKVIQVNQQQGEYKKDYFISVLKKYADFTGRARRKEYWMFILIYIVIQIVFAILGLDVISMIIGLGLLVPSLSISARRLHYTRRTGWWQLIYLVPLIGFIVMIVFLTQDSHDENNYGVNPKSGVPA